jgi:hypothetical protein
MSSAGANARTADDLAWLEKNLDGFVRNIRATAVTKRVSRRRFDHFQPASLTRYDALY